MRPHAERHFTVEDYFAIEESSPIRHEFYGGEIFAMAGASLRHNRIVGNVFAALRARLQTSACEVFASDLRVRTPGGLYTYPDMLVVCGGVSLNAADRLDTVVNPTVLVEVLSESTKTYDRGSRFALYRELPTLREYLLIEQTQMLVEQFVNPAAAGDAAGDWPRRAYTNAAEQVELRSLGVALSLAEVYARVEFESAGEWV
jgi:Uma2 family endonuclease